MEDFVEVELMQSVRQRLTVDMQEVWPKLVATGWTAGLLTALITARFWTVQVGWEIWWEVPAILIVGASVWLTPRRKRRNVA